VKLDRTRSIAVGFSGGGSSAPYIASHEDHFAAFAVLHGGIFRNSLGSHIVRGWLSTGDADGLRPAGGVAESAGFAREKGFADLTVKTFAGGHVIVREERDALLEWWLGS
jgi:predicted esterase